MARKRTSLAFRRTRVRPSFEFRINAVPLLRAAFPRHYNWCMDNRGERLPHRWRQSNMPTLDADFIRFDKTGNARKWLDHFGDRVKKSKWCAKRFENLRQLLGDGIVYPTRVSVPAGQPTSKHPERNEEILRLKMEDEDHVIAATIRKAEAYQREKEEREEERQAMVAADMVSCKEDVFHRFPNVDDLVNYLLHQQTEFEQPDVPFCTNILPFGAKTVFESVQAGLANKKHFYFNLCTTTRPLKEGEWH